MNASECWTLAQLLQPLAQRVKAIRRTHAVIFEQWGDDVPLGGDLTAGQLRAVERVYDVLMAQFLGNHNGSPCAVREALQLVRRATKTARTVRPATLLADLCHDLEAADGRLLHALAALDPE